MQKKNENENFWQDIPQPPKSEQRTHLPAGAALTKPGFPGDPPQPGYTLPPSPLMVHSPADPQGSWTGVPEHSGEQPVQDADDL